MQAPGNKTISTSRSLPQQKQKTNQPNNNLKKKKIEEEKTREIFSIAH